MIYSVLIKSNNVGEDPTYKIETFSTVMKAKDFIAKTRKIEARNFLIICLKEKMLNGVPKKKPLS